MVLFKTMVAFPPPPPIIVGTGCWPALMGLTRNEKKKINKELKLNKEHAMHSNIFSRFKKKTIKKAKLVPQ